MTSHHCLCNSNHWQPYNLFNSLFRLTTKKTPNLRLTDLACAWCKLGKWGEQAKQEPGAIRSNILYHRGHNSDVIMSVMASQITGVCSVCPTACSDADQRKHQTSASLTFVRGIHRWLVNSPHKGPVTRKMFPFDDVIMAEYCPAFLSYSRDASISLWVELHEKEFADRKSNFLIIVSKINVIYVIAWYMKTFSRKWLSCLP